MTTGPIEIDRPGPGNHRTTIVVDGRPVETLADLPPLRNRLLFVGLRPSSASVAAGHYHQGATGQAVWQWLTQARILPDGTAREAADDALVAAGHGITDLLKIPSETDAASDIDLGAGVGALWQKVAIWRPAAVVFLARRVAVIAAGRPLDEPWGALEGVALAGRPCFLLPEPDAPTEQVDEALNFLRNIASALPA